jgi:vancomycin aglycone glucosyltransferase
MRILLAPEGSRGDVQPLVALGAALAMRGAQAVVCAGPEARELVESHGLEFRTTARDNRAYLQDNAGAVIRGGLAFQRAASHFMVDAFEHQFDTVRAAAEGADAIVGAGIQLGAGSVAEALGIPYRFIAYCPILFASSEHPPFSMTSAGRPWLNRALWRAFLALANTVLRPPLARKRAELGLGPVRDVYAYMRSERPILASDPDLGPEPADLEFAVDAVGFLNPPSGKELPGKLQLFLESGPPPVYLGFGSMPDRDPVSTTRTLLGAVEALGLRAVVGRGWAELGDGALPEHVICVDEIPHDVLFPHMACVVHHGGAGTTQTAARAGVPQILVPHLLDQFYWGRRVERIGLGAPMLPRTQLETGALADRLSVIVGNEIVEERARGIAERMAERDPLGAAADRILDAI